MPIPVSVSKARHDPKSPYYERQETQQEREDRMYQKAEEEREKRQIEKAKEAGELE